MQFEHDKRKSELNLEKHGLISRRDSYYDKAH